MKQNPATKDKRSAREHLSTKDVISATSEQLREGYLARLRRLLRLRRDHFDELNEQGLRLLDRSIFAAYCDCLDIGQGDAARAVLKDVQLTVSMARGPRKASA